MVADEAPSMPFKRLRRWFGRRLCSSDKTDESAAGSRRKIQVPPPPSFTREQCRWQVKFELSGPGFDVAYIRVDAARESVFVVTLHNACLLLMVLACKSLKALRAAPTYHDSRCLVDCICELMQLTERDDRTALVIQVRRTSVSTLVSDLRASGITYSQLFSSKQSAAFDYGEETEEERAARLRDSQADRWRLGKMYPFVKSIHRVEPGYLLDATRRNPGIFKHTHLAVEQDWLRSLLAKFYFPQDLSPGQSVRSPQLVSDTATVFQERAPAVVPPRYSFVDRRWQLS